MEKMKSDAPLDYAVFQLSPKHSRCELFVSSGGSTEKLASGLLKPFVAHLKVAEEQVASATQSIMLDPGRNRNADTWFNRGTLERFVRFVSTPEVLEVVNTFDAEMSQLEAARRIYSQGLGDQLYGGGGSELTAADDTTKKELLRAIDVRLEAARQDLTNACARAAAAGFDVGTVSELQIFADRFGAHRLNEACGQFISVFERRPNLINQWKSETEDCTIRSSCNSDMSIDLPSPPLKDLTTHQQPNPPPITFPLRRTFSRESSLERCGENKQDNATVENNTKDETSAPDPKDPIQATQPSRRLSVQDRINMFENKQKENSGGKPIVKSAELRRLSSDVSMMGAAAEKGVLRRWSGVSHMSIDLSDEKKDAESPFCASSLEKFSQENKVLDLSNDIIKSSSVVKPESNVIPSLNMDNNNSLKDDFDNSKQLSWSAKSISNLNSDESDDLNNQGHNKAKSRSFTRKSDNQETSEEKSKIFSGGGSRAAFAFKDHMKSRDSQKGEDVTENQSEIIGGKDQGPSLAESRPTSSKSGGKVHTVYAKEDFETRDKSVVQSSLKSTWKTVEESWASERVSGSRSQEDFAAHHKEIKDDSSAQKESRSTGETEIVENKESIEDSGPQRIKFNRKVSAAELSKKAKVMPEGNSRTPFSGKIVTEAEEGFDSFATPTPGQIQRGRQSKGNHDRNDELKLKANELEKLFAEHKLRVPAEQSNSTRKGKLDDARQLPSSFQCSKPMVDSSPQFSDRYKSNEPTGNLKNKTKLNTASSMKLIDNQNYGDALKKSFSNLSVSEGSRGKLYQKYNQKRDAKLKEDWSSNRADKEAQLKSMQDSLERNKSEMKAKLTRSADREDPVLSARRHAERLRSYNSRSILNREQQHQDFVDCEFDGAALDFQKNHPIEDRVVGDISFEDDFPRASKQLLSNNRNSSSTTPRPSAIPVARSAAKTSTSSLKRRMQPENPLAQSVPNFSDLRKENTKPSSGGGKSTRSQVRNYARGKTTNEETAIVKEDKSRRLQTLRKSSENPSEFKDASMLDSDGVALTQIKFDEEKSMGTKPFLRKGSRAVRSSIAKQRVTKESEAVNDDENDGIASEPDEFKNIVHDEREEDIKNLNSEGDNVLEDREPTLTLDPDKFENSEYENGGDTLTFSALDQALGSQLPREIPSCFLPVESMQDWQNGSPMLWNSHSQNPFSYPHEISDVDASVDSPIGSPSWNSHSLNSMEADTARMRKKWGAAQKPMVAVHSSNSSSRKDMTRGFKRLLKFGRKNRGSETLADWVSVTTSEGDDDTEDGRDLANRSSEDLRKSRMGFSHTQPSDDSFNDSEFFNESVRSSQTSIPAPPANFRLRDDHVSGTSIKAPRSFFSLSTFRSKGNESKPR